MHGPVDQQRQAATPRRKAGQHGPDPGPLQRLPELWIPGQHPLQAAVTGVAGDGAEQIQRQLALDEGAGQLDGDHQGEQVLPLRFAQVAPQWRQQAICVIMRMHRKPPGGAAWSDRGLLRRLSSSSRSRFTSQAQEMSYPQPPGPLSQKPGEGERARARARARVGVGAGAGVGRGKSRIL